MANFNHLKKFHFIYKTTNLINGDYYIGMHSTNNIEDKYLGSGKRLKRSIKKHGIENFIFKILEYVCDLETLKNREREIVNVELLLDPKCINLKIGGFGGFSHENQVKNSPKGLAKLRELMKDPIFLKKYKKNLSDGIKRGLRKRSKNGYWDGKKHSDETKGKMSESNKNKHIGDKNSQYGTCWITNGIDNMKIIKNKILLPDDWYYGRTMKK